MIERKTVLLLQDSTRADGVQRSTLRNCGYTVVTATTGKEAVERLRTGPHIDVVLIDINPGEGRDGVEAAGIILKEKDIPVIFLLNSAGAEEIEKAEISAPYGYAFKDLGKTVFSTSIRTALKLCRSHGELQKREEEYRLLFGSSSSGIFIAQDNMLRFVNPAVARITGYSMEDLTTKPFTNLIHPDDIGMIMDRYTRRLQGRAVETSYPFRIIKADGTVRWVEITSVPTSWRGKPASLNYVIDITERKHAEKFQKLFASAFNLNPDPMAITEWMTGKIIHANSAFSQWTGYSATEFVGVSTADLGIWAHPEDREMAMSLLISAGEIRDRETLMRQKNGNARNVLYSARFIEIDQERYLLSVVHDITELKQAQGELRESKELYTRLVNNVRDAIVRTDLEGNILFVNDYSLQVSGYAWKEIEGKNMAAFISPDEWDKLIHNRSLLMNKTFGPREYRLITKDGREIPFEVNSDVLRAEDGTPLGVVSVCRDISERKRAERALVESEQKYRNVIENSLVGFYVIKDGLFRYVNRQFCEILGYTYEEIVGKTGPLDLVYPDDRELMAENIRKRESGETDRVEYNFRARRKDGRIINLKVIGTTMTYEGTLVPAGNILDITRETSLETQLRQSQKMEAIGTLAGGIAHDFNNILTALMGYSTLMQMQMDASNPLRPCVDEVLAASEKAADLTRSLLAFSRQQPTILEPLNVNEAIRTAEKLLGRLLTENIDLRTSLTGDDTVIMADKSQMDQILLNLVANARDAMTKGGTLSIETSVVTVDNDFVKARGYGKPGRYVQIDVSDTGTGIDSAIKEKIFDPFFTTKEIGKGTGLGLATVYAIATQHNGFVTVESAPNRGTTFSIRFPVVQASTDEKPKETTQVMNGNETILIAEDNHEVRNFVHKALHQYGYSIIEAVDGSDAIEKFKQHPQIDLVLLDSVMPKKSGLAVYEEIRRIDQRVKVLFTSGYTRDVILDKRIESGEFSFISKPLSLGELLAKLREVLDR